MLVLWYLAMFKGIIMYCISIWLVYFQKWVSDRWVDVYVEIHVYVVVAHVDVYVFTIIHIAQTEVHLCSLSFFMSADNQMDRSFSR